MPKTKVPKKVPKKVIKEDYKEDYTVTAKIFGRDYSATGSTLIEALNKLEIRNAKGKCILIVEKGKKKKEERILMPALTYRLFNTLGISKEVSIKNVSLMFGL